ncbi:MAG: YeeE/YedE thiosulfate transporter family protein [Solirubrobacteraceae bacterium]
MALAGGCVTGMLWKAGTGALALAVAIAGFAVGELLVRGPGDGVIAALDDAARPRESAVPELLGAGYEPVAAVLGLAALALLLRRGLSGVVAGLARHPAAVARLDAGHRVHGRGRARHLVPAPRAATGAAPAPSAWRRPDRRGRTVSLSARPPGPRPASGVESRTNFLKSSDT